MCCLELSLIWSFQRKSSLTIQKMTKRLTQTFLLLLLTNFLFSQETATVSGTIIDNESGETLIGASVFAAALDLGTTTNEYGFYSLSVPISNDSISLYFSYVGFQTQTQKVKLTTNFILNIELGTGIELQEVVVKANSVTEELNSTQMSVETITTKEVKLIPALLGESDILKTIQLKPGIPSGSEGTTGLYVRGGGNDQNLIILDEAVVYNANHLFGFFSTFNTDAIKDLKLYKGGFPAQYGGRLSSVIDVRMKEGNNRKFSGAGGIGLIASRLTVEGPIQKEKSSFIVSGRRTYVDVFTRQVNKVNESTEDYTPIPDYYFYDLNTKVNFKLSEKDKIYLSGYFGRDVFKFDGDFFDFSFDWGNATGTARWNHVFNPKLFSNTTFTYSDYNYSIETRVTGFSFQVGSDVKDANLKTDFYYALNNKHTLRFGGNATYHQFGVGRLKGGSDDGEVSFSAGQSFDGLQFGAYLADEFEPNKNLKINAGLRLSGFSNDGKTYLGLEPRLSAKYSLNDRMSLKASYARMMQYLHLVSTSGIALPTDVWYPTTKQIEPQISDQIALGFNLDLGNGLFLTNEYYYKWLNKQVSFVDWADLFANDNLEEEFAIGKGFGYGMEVGLEKKIGKLTGWIGYTLALVKTGKFVPVGADNRYSEADKFISPRYDRRHDVSVVAIYELNRRISITGTFVYGSGDLTWLPTGRFVFQDIHGAPAEVIVPDFEGRNNLRLPYFLRVDAGLVYRFFPKWGEQDLTLSIFNATNRRNAFFLYIEPIYATEQGTNGNILEVPVALKAKQVSLFPILASVTWNFKF